MRITNIRSKKKEIDMIVRSIEKSQRYTPEPQVSVPCTTHKPHLSQYYPLVYIIAIPLLLMYSIEVLTPEGVLYAVGFVMGYVIRGRV